MYLPSATNLLAEEHQQIEETFRKFQEAEDLALQVKLAESLCRALENHGRMEEGLFYPAVARALPEPGMIGELAREHARIRRLISDLRLTHEEGPLTLALRMQVAQLMARVRAHVVEEEELAFPFLKADPRRDLQLGSEMAKLQTKFRLIPPLVRSTVVQAPVRWAYHQWTRFETFPLFLEEVKAVRQPDPVHVDWDMVIGGREVRWRTAIVEQIPDERIAWRSVEGAVHTGSVTFRPVTDGSTRLLVEIVYEPQGLLEDVGAMLGVVGRKLDKALIQFRDCLETGTWDTGAWRGQFNG